VARFLSQAWFDEVENSDTGDHGADGPGRAAYPEDHLVLEQIVTGTPDGEIRYLVLVAGGRARVKRGRVLAGQDGGEDTGGEGAGAQLTITCDWPTASAIAQGRLSTQRALMQGRLRVRGSPAPLLGRNIQLARLDPIPPEVRKNTTY